MSRENGQINGSREGADHQAALVATDRRAINRTSTLNMVEI